MSKRESIRYELHWKSKRSGCNWHRHSIYEDYLDFEIATKVEKIRRMDGTSGVKLVKIVTTSFYDLGALVRKTISKTEITQDKNINKGLQ